MRKAVVPIVLFVATIVAAALLVAPDESDDRLGIGRGPGAGSRITGLSSGEVTLVSFDSCQELVGHLKEGALAQMDAQGGWFGGAATDVALEASAPAAGDDFDAGGGAARATSQASGAPVAGKDYSATNVQEAGVDEPDEVKTDGTTIFTTAGGRLRAIRATGTPTLLGTLDLPGGVAGDGGHELLLHGSKLLVLSRTWEQPSARPAPQTTTGDIAIQPVPGGASRTLLTEVDVADPANLRKGRTVTLDGDYRTARLIGSRARIVVNSNLVPQVDVAYPTSGDERAREAALAHNRKAIESTTIDDWLPTMEVDGATTPLARCDDTSRPADFSGLGMTAVVTVDLDEGLKPSNPAAVVGAGEHVYASQDTLYLSSTRWIAQAAPGEAADTRVDIAPPGEVATQLHAFDLRGEGEARYVGSGEVKGTLLNQFSMSEHDGHLRVATTLERFDRAGAGGESQVAVLALRDDKLEEVGVVGGLGRGERIYAVRFVGDIGFVVTFRQTDPLYTLDLADPAAPKVLGELKINGYSAYLHPIDDDRLVGVGQDATDEGRRLGTQVSVFDVADLSKPTRISQVRVGGAGQSTAEYDHRAFLWWERTRTVVIPQQDYGLTPDGRTTSAPFFGVVTLRISDEGTVAETGRISHPTRPSDGQEDFVAPDGRQLLVSPAITRSLVVGDTLFTLSGAGLKANALDGLTERGFVAF